MRWPLFRLDNVKRYDVRPAIGREGSLCNSDAHFATRFKVIYLSTKLWCYFIYLRPFGSVTHIIFEKVPKGMEHVVWARFMASTHTTVTVRRGELI
jgi:hypothetical protein